jgi:hypothetical protein
VDIYQGALFSSWYIFHPSAGSIAWCNRRLIDHTIKAGKIPSCCCLLENLSEKLLMDFILFIYLFLLEILKPPKKFLFVFVGEYTHHPSTHFVDASW